MNRKCEDPHHKSRRRNRNEGQKGHDKFVRRSQSRDKIQCFHYGKEGHMKRNCQIWKREQNKQNQEKEDDKNTIVSISNNDEVLMLSNECLHVDEQRVEWIVDTIASYHATLHLELFSNYRVGDFGTVKMRNSSYSKIVRMGDVCFETNTRRKMRLKYVRHVPDLCLNLMSSLILDKQGYENHFGKGK